MSLVSPQRPGIDVVNTPISGCVRVMQPTHRDERGWFTKSLSDSVRTAMGYPFEVNEIYWSLSQNGVIRGMHFQLPPANVAKLVWVATGEIRDVVLDLRTDSETFGTTIDFILGPHDGSLLIPRGCAHGFSVHSDSALVFYAQDGPFSPDLDAGVRWNSFGFDWHNSAKPVVSTRDQSLPTLEDFESPFRMQDR